MTKSTSIIPAGRIQRSILLIRGQKVMLDADLAQLHGVGTRVLVQAVRRNVERLPHVFMFQLTKEESALLRSQSVTSGFAPPARKRPLIGFAAEMNGPEKDNRRKGSRDGGRSADYS